MQWLDTPSTKGRIGFVCSTQTSFLPCRIGPSWSGCYPRRNRRSATFGGEISLRRDSGGSSLSMSLGSILRTQPSPYQKVAISRALLQSAPAFHIGAGTHSVARTPLGGDLRGKPTGVIYHIPIRSLDRLSVKIRAAVAALRAKRGRGLTETFHWFELENAILHGRLDEAALRRIALSYGEPLNLAAEWPECETISWSLPLAGVPLLARAKSMGEVEVGNSAVQWAHWSLATGDVDTIAVVKTDHITLQRAPLGKRLLGAMLRMYSWIRGGIRKLRSASG